MSDCDVDESKNSIAPNMCSRDNECHGKRTCSHNGWCMGDSECPNWSNEELAEKEQAYYEAKLEEE